LRFQPVVELVDPVITGCALFLHAEAVMTSAVNMDFGLDASGFNAS
jgi:hypothetical protein